MTWIYKARFAPPTQTAPRSTRRGGFGAISQVRRPLTRCGESQICLMAPERPGKRSLGGVRLRRAKTPTTHSRLFFAAVFVGATLLVFACQDAATPVPSAPTPPAPAPPPPPAPPPTPPTPPIVAAPCSGVVVRGVPSSPSKTDEKVVQTTLYLELGAGSQDVVFDWTGPYGWGQFERRREEFDAVQLDLYVFILDWSTEMMEGGYRHTVTLAWPAGRLAGLEVSMQFRSDSGACPGEPTVACDESGCALRS